MYVKPLNREIEQIENQTLNIKVGWDAGWGGKMMLNYAKDDHSLTCKWD